MIIPELNKEESIKKLNLLASQGSKFLFFIDFNASRCCIVDDISQSTIRFQINGTQNFVWTSLPAKIVNMEIQSIPFSQYRKSFDIVHKHLHYGNSYLTNLTFRTPIKLNLSLEEVFYRSQALYKLYVPDNFVVFSPERFVFIDKNGIVSSNPMKGTIDASIPGAETLILNDAKEMAEHNTIVDLIRNDLNRVAFDVQVKRFRYIDKIQTSRKTLLQVSSEIVGLLTKNWTKNLGNIIYELLPAGSISGAPKPKTLEIINDAETCSRGFYTGIVGYFDGSELDTGVMIRFIENEKGFLYYRSGGGITVNSNAENEYQEMLDKIYVPIY